MNLQLNLSDEVNTEQLFKELYYHLYSNGNTSRSERILSDLSKLILVFSLNSQGKMLEQTNDFLLSKSKANGSLLKSLKHHLGDSIDKKETFSLDDESLRVSLTTIKKINLQKNPSLIFGDAFQALMGPRIRGDKGQFFTPRAVVRAMVQIISPRLGSKLIDPACGTGGFLLAALDHWHSRGGIGNVVGIDKDKDLAFLASSLSATLGRDDNIEIHCNNSLDIGKNTAIGKTLGTYDYVLTNPPFGSKIGITKKEILREFELGHEWKYLPEGNVWKRIDSIKAVQDPQMLFVELCVKLLKNGGKLAIVLPEGLFGNKKSAYLWQYLRENGKIDALIDCPRTTFQPSTDVKTNILFFTKEARSAGANHSAWVSVAYNCGHDKRGRTLRSDNRPVTDDFSKLAKDWELKSKDRKIWNKVDISNSSYLVPRYFDKTLEDKVRSVANRLNSRVVTLGELLDEQVITIRKGHEVGSEAYGTGDIPFIRTSDIQNFETSFDSTKSISKAFYDKYKCQQNLQSGNILMVVDGRYRIGKCAILHEWTTQCVIQSHLKIISVIEEKTCPPISLLFALSLADVQYEIRRLVFVQSTLGSIGSRINEIRIPDPRQSNKWGTELAQFKKAINGRAILSKTLSSFGKEIEL